MSSACLALAAAPARAADEEPYSFLVAPTDQLAIPGFVAGTLLTPTSDIFTGYTELALRFGDRRVAMSGRRRTMRAGRYPVFEGTYTDGPVRYDLRIFSEVVAGRPVNFARVEMTNTTRRTRGFAELVVFVRDNGGKLRPRGERMIRKHRFPRPITPTRDGFYWQPGVRFNPEAVYSFDGNALLRDGSLLYVSNPPSRGVRRNQTVRSGSGPVVPGSSLGQTEYVIALRPGERRVIDVRMPVEPVGAATPLRGSIERVSVGQMMRRAMARWAAVHARVPHIGLPDPKVVDTYYASIYNMLAPRYRLPGDGTWVQPVNKLRYHAFWLRDASIITRTYNLLGLHREAAQNLRFFFDWQRDDGLFISREEEYDGFGQTLWAFWEYASRTRSAAFARTALPAVERAMEWFVEARAGDPLGLMPPVTTGFDNELTPGHLAGDNLWALAGIRGAVRLALLGGRRDLAIRWAAELRRYRRSVEGHVTEARLRTRGFIPPALDSLRGQDWGNYWAAYPVESFPADGEAVGATLVRARSRFREGIATYADVTMLHAYLGFRVFQTHLLRNEQRYVVQGLYDELAHTTSTNSGFETNVGVFGSRDVDDATSPHGWWAAEYVTLLRNMLVREDGRTVVLGSALSPGWLAPGRTVEARGFPTLYGPVSFRLRGVEGGAILEWSSEVRGARLAFARPAWALAISAPGLDDDRDRIALPGSSGRILIRWRLQRSGLPSFDAAVRRLVALYENAPPPSPPAPDGDDGDPPAEIAVSPTS